MNIPELYKLFITVFFSLAVSVASIVKVDFSWAGYDISKAKLLFIIESSTNNGSSINEALLTLSKESSFVPKASVIEAGSDLPNLEVTSSLIVEVDTAAGVVDSYSGLRVPLQIKLEEFLFVNSFEKKLLNFDVLFVDYRITGKAFETGEKLTVASGVLNTSFSPRLENNINSISILLKGGETLDLTIRS